MKLGAFFALLCVAGVSALSTASWELGPALHSLADALRREFLRKGDNDEVVEAAARQRLEQEADRLAEQKDAGSKVAADLIRKLSRQSVKENDTSGFASPPRHSSSVSHSSEVTVVSDKDGTRHVRRHVKNCRDGSCEEREEDNATDDSETAPSKIVAAAQEEEEKADEEESRAVEDEAENVARHMTNTMRRMQADMNAFEDMFPTMGDDFWNRFRGSEKQGIRASFQHSGRLGSSESVSEETVMQNGHAVHRIKRCKNGKCSTKVDEGDLVTDSSGSDAPSLPSEALDDPDGFGWNEPKQPHQREQREQPEW